MEKIKNTNWTSPKTNIFAGINDLRRALASGYKAKLIRAYNEQCEYPIKEKLENRDFRNYEFSIGYASSITRIKEDPNKTEFEKQLSLNYVSVFGSDEAMKRYYETGVLGEDNFKNMGRNHLVHVDDIIKYLEDRKDVRANMYKQQYRSPEHVNDVSHFFDFYRYKHGSPYAIKKFKTKLWVIVLLGKDEKQPRIPVMTRIIMNTISALVYPLKYVPRRDVLRMPEYKIITYRIGAVVNGYSMQIQIPKKFSFK